VPGQGWASVTPRRYGLVVAGWSPWRELRARTNVTLEWRDLPRTHEGAWIPTAAGAVIVLASWLTRRERRCVLSHELVHDERGIAFDEDIAAAVIQKEEAYVDRESVRRLVPLDELQAFVDVRSEIEPVTVVHVAEAFDVTTGVARSALERLASPR
jgi:hypothetical protein